jgi:hypothetical protein
VIEVIDQFPGESCATRIWVTHEVAEAIDDYVRSKGKIGRQFLDRLKRYADNGFSFYEGPNHPIRSEWGGVYRIGHPIDLFRLIGFYADGSKAEFIIVDSYIKKGQKLSARERARIDRAADVKRLGTWKRG